jgi:hypothetical protein
MAFDELFFRIHAIERMLQHDILEVEVREILEHGDVIESGADQHGMPKRLYLGFINKRPIHVATIDDEAMSRTEVITVYEANLQEWNPGFRRRRLK